MRSRSRLVLPLSGFSLIEVMVATFILLVGLLALFEMFPTSAQAVANARTTYSATQIAREQMEAWLIKGYTTIVASPATMASGTVYYTDQANGVTQSWPYTYQVTHSAIVAAKVEQVEAYVQWHERGGLNGPVSSLNSVRLDSWVINGWQTP